MLYSGDTVGSKQMHILPSWNYSHETITPKYKQSFKGNIIVVTRAVRISSQYYEACNKRV